MLPQETWCSQQICWDDDGLNGKELVLQAGKTRFSSPGPTQNLILQHRLSFTHLAETGGSLVLRASQTSLIYELHTQCETYLKK